jgi:nucleoside-diphosphate-sugar epimerase
MSNSMRVLITGGSGFIGTNLVDAFLADGVEVLNLDLEPPRNAGHRDAWRPVSLFDPAALAAACREFAPTHFLHMAARTDLKGASVADYAANVQGLANTIDCIRQLDSLEMTVFASTRMVCRIGYQPRDEFDYCPSTPYGESKVIGERLVRESALETPWVMVRPTSIWGPWFDIPYRTFFDAVERGRFFHVRGANPRKSFGYVGNTVHQVRRLLAAPDQVAGRTLYLADYPPLELREFAELVRAAFGARRLYTVPRAALVPLARAGDFARDHGWGEPPLTTFRLDNLLTEMTYDLTELKTVVGELPYSLPDGVRETVGWMRRQPR